MRCESEGQQQKHMFPEAQTSHISLQSSKTTTLQRDNSACQSSRKSSFYPCFVSMFGAERRRNFTLHSLTPAFSSSPVQTGFVPQLCTVLQEEQHCGGLQETVFILFSTNSSFRSWLFKDQIPLPGRASLCRTSLCMEQ